MVVFLLSTIQKTNALFVINVLTFVLNQFLNPRKKPWQAKASISDKCLAQQNVECRSCGDMCEPMAIQFQLRAGSVALPKIELDECNGCGACVAVCPTSAILVSNA